MPSTKAFLNKLLDRLSPLGDVSCRPMMGEYVLYCRGRVVGGVYDDRVLLKPAKAALALLAERSIPPVYAIPYPGAKPMLQIDAEDAELMIGLVSAAAEELPPPKRKRPKEGA